MSEQGESILFLSYHTQGLNAVESIIDCECDTFEILWVWVSRINFYQNFMYAE